jgi:hypothetical protein
LAARLAAHGVTDPGAAAGVIRREMATVALFSDGGWFLTAGDESGVLPQAHATRARPEDLGQRLPGVDVSGFVRELNATVAHLPPPAVKPEWSQRVLVPGHPGLVVFIQHRGEGFQGPARTHLVIANTGEEDVTVTLADVRQLMRANGRNAGTVSAPDGTVRPRDELPGSMHLCGPLAASADLLAAPGLQVVSARALLRDELVRCYGGPAAGGPGGPSGPSI